MTVRRWVLTATGAAVGLLAVGGYAAVEALSDPYPATASGSTTWHCAGAEVTATAFVRDGGVLVRVTVDDPQLRTWRVRLPSYGHGLLATRAAGADAGLTAPTGDLDDGPHRRVDVRPQDPGSWCERTVSLR